MFQIENAWKRYQQLRGDKTSVLNDGRGIPTAVKSLTLILFVCEQGADDTSTAMRRKS